MRINQTVVALAKRDAESDPEYEKAMQEIEERKKTCKGLEYGGHVTGFITNLIGDVPDIPLIGVSGKSLFAGLAMFTHAIEFGMNIASTALDCDDLNFDEIKLIMDKRFNEVDRKLDKLTQAMEKITEIATKTLGIVEKTRAEMKWGFKNVLATLKNMEIHAILSRINKFSRYFEDQNNEISRLSTDDFIFRLKEEHGILEYLEKALKPEGLHYDLLELMDKNTKFAIPEKADDTSAFQALYALFYGTQTYASVMFFLLKQHAYLADYYYQNGKDREFNNQFDLLKKTFNSFNSSLTGSNGVINEVVRTLEDVKLLPFIKDVKNNLYADISKREGALNDLKSNITKLEIDVITDVPLQIDDLDFKDPIVLSNYGDWNDKPLVRYAVQLRDNGTYSKFSQWSKPLKVDGKANPVIQVPRDEKERERLVFRKFNDGEPQLAGILSKSQVKFQDIDRDLYNAAGSKDQNKSLEYIPTLLAAGANVNAVFEMKRSVMHAAAESGNVKIALRYLRNKIPLDVQDEKGFTPMHIAASTKNAGFVNFLVTYNASVNAQTTLDKLTPLHLAAKKGYSNAVRNLLESDQSTNSIHQVNQPDKSGYTPLHYAVSGTVQTIEMLLAKNETLVNAKSDFGLTPFHLAVMKGNHEICDAFLNSGKVQVNAGNRDNMTALHFAAMAGNVDMVQYLLSIPSEKVVDKVDINAVTSNNTWTPLLFAIYFKNEDAAIELIKNPNVNISIASKENITPLHLSIATGQLNIFEELLKKEPNIETKTKEGYTALHLAALRDDTSFTAKLLSKKAIIDELSNDNSTALHLASKSDKNSEVKILLQNGANMRLRDNSSYLPIHYSIRNVNSEAVNEFIKQDKSIIDSSNDEGKSLMEYAMKFIAASFYHYYRYRDTVEYQKYKDFKSEEVFEKLGYFDLIRVLLHDYPEEQSLKCGFYLFNSIALGCLKSEYAGNPICNNMTFEIPTPKIPHSNQNRDNFYKSKLQIENTDFLMAKSRDNRYPFSLPKNTRALNIDPIGTLLLLDVLVRKLTNEKLKDYTLDESSRSLDSRALALGIAEDFSKYIDAVSDASAEELIDFAKLHSDLYKAINGGKYKSIHNILSSQAKGLIEPLETDFYLSVFLPSNFSETGQTREEYFRSLWEECGFKRLFNFRMG